MGWNPSGRQSCGFVGLVLTCGFGYLEDVECRAGSNFALVVHVCPEPDQPLDHFCRASTTAPHRGPKGLRQIQCPRKRLDEKSLERCKRPVATADIKHGDIDLIFCMRLSTRITQNADPFWIVGYRRIGHARHDAAIHASTRGYEQACGIAVLEEHSEVECRHRDRTPYLIRHQAEEQHVNSSAQIYMYMYI